VLAPDAGVREEVPHADAARPSDADGVATRTVSREDGRVLVVERWRWAAGRLREITLDLRPRMLRHHAERGVEITTEAKGSLLGRAPYRATSVIEDLPRGATVAIAFRDPLPGIDRLAAGAGPDGTVPDRIELLVGGVRRTWARFEAVRAADGAPDAEREARLARLADELAAHRSAMGAFDEAIRTGHDEPFAASTQAVAARHESAGLSPARRADEWWIAAARLADGGRPDRAAAVLAGRWRDLVHAQSHAPSGAGCESDGMASIAASVTNVAFEPNAAGEAGESGDDIRCGTAARHPTMQTVLDAIARAITRAAFETDARRCMMQAICRASDDPEVVASVAMLDAGSASGIEQELSDALRGGDLPLPEAVTGMAGTPPAPDECQSLATHVMGRAVRQPASAAAVADARVTHERASADAVRILRRALERAGLAHDVAARIGRDVAGRLSARRKMIGNRFSPAMDPSHFRPSADPVDMDAELARAGLADTVEREFARVEALRAIAREQDRTEDVRSRSQEALADSRARTAEHRLSTLVERAVDRATMRVAR
jgi:hypothetical protein